MTRYLDLMSNFHEYFTLSSNSERIVRVDYLILFKLTYIGLQFLILTLFVKFNKSGRHGTSLHTGGNYEQHRDTTNIWFILVPTFFVSLYAADSPTWFERLWTWSEYLEAFVMIPQ